MKQTHRCPKCGCDRILNINQPLPAVTTSRGHTTPIKLAIAAPIETAQAFGIKVIEPQYVGDLEAAVCTQCGLVELYAKNVGVLYPDGVYVRELPPLPKVSAS